MIAGDENMRMKNNENDNNNIINNTSNDNMDMDILGGGALKSRETPEILCG